MLSKASNSEKTRPTRANIYVDTSFFIATQVANHPFHGVACELLAMYESSTFFFSLLTIDEIVYTLQKHRIKRDQIPAIIHEKIIAIKNAKILTYKNGMKDLEEYVKTWNDTQLAPRDALHIYLMRSQKIKHLATFDKEFKRRQEQLGIEILALPS